MHSTRSPVVIEELLKLDDLNKTVNHNYPLLWHCARMWVRLNPTIMKYLIDQIHVRYDGTLPIDIGKKVLM